MRRYVDRIGDGVFFDVFRFADGLVVEHWGFSAEAGAPNRSGHTQVDGPTEAEHVEDTEKNKAPVREYYEAVHIGGRHDRISDYFSDDVCVRHEPGVADGVDEIRLLLGRGTCTGSRTTRSSSTGASPSRCHRF